MVYSGHTCSGVYITSATETILTSTIIHGSGMVGLTLSDSDSTFISTTTVTNNIRHGILIESSRNTQMNNTTAMYTNLSSIYILKSMNTSVTRVTTNHSFKWIIVQKCVNTNVSHSEFVNYSFVGVHVIHSNNTSLSNLSTGYHSVNYGLLFEVSNHITITNVTLNLKGYYGLYFSQTRNTEILNSTITDCEVGIFLKDAVDTHIENTTTLYNKLDIFVIDNSQRTTITRTTVTSSDRTYGITLQGVLDSYINDMAFVNHKYPVNNSLTNLEVRVNNVINIVDCENTTLKINFSKQSRGITVFNSANVTFLDSSFNDVNFQAITSGADPATFPAATFPAVIVLYFSTVEVHQCHFARNSISSVKAIGSSLTLRGNISFVNNTAISGTAFLLVHKSRMCISKDTYVNFNSNLATNTGGVLYIDTYMVYFNSANAIIPATECFIDVDPDSRHEKRLSFTNNTAGKGGGIIYGGQIALGWKKGWNCFRSFMNVSNISQSGFSLVSSAPSRVCICDSNGTPDCLTVFDSIEHIIYPGQTINISAVVVGQQFGTVTGSVFAQFLHRSERPRLDSWQYTQNVTKNECHRLSFSLYSKPHESDIVLILTSNQRYISHIASKEEVNKTIQFWKSASNKRPDGDVTSTIQHLYEYPVYVNVSLHPCPPGFKLTTDPPYMCECNELLQGLGGVKCYIYDVTVERSGLVWVGGNDSVVVSEYCPYNYCKKEKVNVTLSDPDSQCDYNHAGTLCGQCQQGLSLALGSSKCLPCSNKYLALIIPFLLAGLALVLFIKVLDLTISQGTINALIFFANIVKANEYIFLPQDLSHINIFISWLNLDLGIETCFANGLTPYSKTWLQFVFPLYIWSIAGLIILLARYNSRVARVMGNNSVPLLATLFLLSYAKLLRNIITALSYTIVYTSHGSKVVWSADGSLDYLGPKHVPLFAVAVAVLLFLWFPYTLVLFLGQWLYKINWQPVARLMTKLKPFLDAHYNPFKSRHRYWFGALLLVRAIILLASALIPNNSVSVILLCVSVSTPLVAYFGQMVYCNLAVSMFNTAFYMNLTILGGATLFTTTNGGNQTVVASILIGLMFIQFLGVVLLKIVHLCKCKEQMNACVHKRNNSEDDWEPYEQAALLRDVESDSDSEGQESDGLQSIPTYGM